MEETEFIHTERLLNSLLKKEEEDMPEEIRNEMNRESEYQARLFIPDWCDVAKEEHTSPEDDHTESILNLLLREKQMPLDIRRKLNDGAERFFGSRIVSTVGNFLHRLDDRKHTEDQVRRVIEWVPEALSEENIKEKIPIQSATHHLVSLSFIPLLAEEGMKYNVGGDGMRGGLMIEFDCDNVFSFLLKSRDFYEEEYDFYRSRPSGTYTDDDYGIRAVDVMRRLCEMNLMKKEDIKNLRLLDRSGHAHCERQFNFLVDWHPNELLDSTCTFRYGVRNIDKFEVGLEAAIRHFPQEFGYLFRDSGRRYEDGINLVYDVAYKRFGAENAWEVIEEYTNHLIDLDVASNLYPFMVAASNGSTSRYCLDLIYHLIRKDPQVLKKDKIHPATDRIKMVAKKKDNNKMMAKKNIGISRHRKKEQREARKMRRMKRMQESMRESAVNVIQR